jgi:hypothetical protein
LGDEELFVRLVEAGIERRMAARLVELLPIAYGRILLADSGIIFNENYQRMDNRGKISPEQSLASVPLWREIVTHAEEEISHNISNQEMIAVASRSAEYHVCTELSVKGTIPGDVRLTPCVFSWPVDGPEIGDGSDKKKWWQFWQ